MENCTHTIPGTVPAEPRAGKLRYIYFQIFLLQAWELAHSTAPSTSSRLILSCPSKAFTVILFRETTSLVCPHGGPKRFREGGQITIPHLSEKISPKTVQKEHLYSMHFWYQCL